MYVCGSLCGEKLFLLIIIPFTGLFIKKFSTNPNFSKVMPLSNMVRKTNFLSFSVFVSDIANFMSKKKSSLWISTKMLHNDRKA